MRNNMHYECDQCGACCRKLIIEIDHIDVVREPSLLPVTVHVTRLLGSGQRLWDSSSIGRGNWKEIEDALVACGWFHDDGPKWIVETRYFQRKIPGQDRPTVLVAVFQPVAKEKQLTLIGMDN